ncbi:MAG: hypothetical protein ABI969_08295 [bacterium]
MSGRAAVVLSRFPAHLDAARPGKQLTVVADAVSVGLDDLSASLANIRRSHRLAHADATSDIQLLGALHRIGADEFAPIEARVERLLQAAQALEDAADATARDVAAEALCDLLAVTAARPRLALFAPPTTGGAPPDLAAASVALVKATRALVSYEGKRESYRARVRAICAIHSRGNGTVSALLEAATSALDLEIDGARARAFKAELRPVVTVTQTAAAATTSYGYVVVARSLSKNVDRQSAVVTTTTGNALLSVVAGNVLTWTLPPDARDFLVFRVSNGADAMAVGLLTPVALSGTTTTFTDSGQPAIAGVIDAEADNALFHSRDRFWHAAFVRERAPVVGAPAGGSEIIGMEENPVRRETTPDTPRINTELFPVYRRGFGRSLLQVHVTGIGNRTLGPMLVNRDEGRGIGFSGKVPDGSLLVFDEAGKATLDGADVTTNAFAWQGACFASNDDDPAAPHDFVFDGTGVTGDRRAVFAVATPFDALDGAFVFPSAGNPLTVPGVGIGTTRYAFFVQEAHFSGADDSVSPAVPIPTSPRTHVGFLDAAVFAPPPDAAQQPAANVSLSWLEHEAFALRILLPRRFSSFDITGKPAMTELVRRALERHRPAGVDVRVEYVDDRWVLGTSDVTAGSSPDPILSLRGGSVLWTSPAPTP